jgi:hypothetical protein
MVSKIILPLLPNYPLMDHNDLNGILFDVKNFIIKQLSIVPFHVRLGVYFMSVPYVLSGFISKKIQRSLFFPVDRLYRSLVLLAYYDHPIVVKKLKSMHLSDKE